MENGHEINKLILARLESLDSKLDEVRTETLPQMKIDVALLVEHNKTSSKIYSGVGSLIAIIASTFISHVKR